MASGKSITLFMAGFLVSQVAACSKNDTPERGRKDVTDEARDAIQSPNEDGGTRATRRRPAEHESRQTDVTSGSKTAYRHAMIEGSAKLYSGLYEQALSHYFAAMDARPKHMSPALGALRCLVVKGHAEERANIARIVGTKIKSLASNPKTRGAAYLLEARLAIALGKTGEALDKARLAVQRLPKLGVAWRVLGEAAMGAESWGQAVAALEEAARLGLKAAPGTWERLADALDELGHVAEAQAAAEKALSLTGADPNAHRRRLNLLAAILKHGGRLEEALETVRKALALGPEDPAILHNKASLVEATGKIEEAVTLYQAALKIGRSPTTSWRLGHALLKLERHAEAFEAFKDSAGTMDRWSWPRSTRWLPSFELGKLHYRARLHRRSIHWFEIALREARTFESSKRIRSWLAFVSGEGDEEAP